MENSTAHPYPVFIFDDLEENRKAAEEYFLSAGIPVVFATSFQETKAVLEARNAIFQAYIFDVQAPIRDGEEPTDCSEELEAVASANHAHPHIFASGRDELDGHGRKQTAYAFEALKGFEKSRCEGMMISGTKADSTTWGMMWDEIDKSIWHVVIKAKENAGWGM